MCNISVNMYLVLVTVHERARRPPRQAAIPERV